jgi:hypothetical protein
MISSLAASFVTMAVKCVCSAPEIIKTWKEERPESTRISNLNSNTRSSSYNKSSTRRGSPKYLWRPRMSRRHDVSSYSTLGRRRFSFEEGPSPPPKRSKTIGQSRKDLSIPMKMICKSTLFKNEISKNLLLGHPCSFEIRRIGGVG